MIETHAFSMFNTHFVLSRDHAGWGEFVRKFCKQSLGGKCPKEFVQKAWLSEISLEWLLLTIPMALDLGSCHFHMKVAVLYK